MHRIFAVLLVFAAGLPGQQPPPDWRTETNLPGNELKSLSPAQQKIVLSVLREFGCPCGCDMKVAQCRVQDPACSQSLTLAKVAIEAAAAGRNAAQIRKALEDSALVKAAAQKNRLLLDPVQINILGAPVKGPAGARITLVEFSDFQCPFCTKAAKDLNALMEAYPNDVRLVYKQFPLDTHSQAALAARASLAAHAQGKFWPLHDKMYANSRGISRDAVLAWAKELGLDMQKFAAVFDSPQTRAAVERDLADGSRAGVDATPTIFINGKKYQGSLDASKLGAVIAEELKKL